MNRILYIDGFNFYYGVTQHWKERDPKLVGLGWCDFGALMRKLFGPKEGFRIKYFTSPVTQNAEIAGHRPGEHERYSLWLRALATIGNLSIIRGYYKDGSAERPDARWKAREEKQTDVNLAIEMLMDAFGPPEGRPDHVILLSGDTDLMPAIFALLERFARPIHVTVLLPSNGNRDQWSATYNETRTRLRKCHGVSRTDTIPGRPLDVRLLDETILANCLLPYELRDANGAFFCPPYWRLEENFLSEHCETLKRRPDLARCS